MRAVAPDGVDAALDGAGAQALRASVAVAKDRSRVMSMVDDEEAERLGLPLIRGTRTAERLAEVTDLYAKGLLRVHVRATFPLAQAAAAQREVESGHGRGKVILTMAG